MRNFLKVLLSLRTKLAFSFVALTAVFMALYLGLARRTLHDDKQEFVYLAQQSQVSALARAFDERADQTLLEARALLLGYDPRVEHLNAIAQKLFWGHLNLLAIEVTRASGPARGLNLEKLPGLLLKLRAVPASSEPGKVVARALGENHFALVVRVLTPEPLNLRVVMNFHSALGSPLPDQIVAILDGQNVITRSMDPRVSEDTLKSLAARLAQTNFDMTNVHQLGREDFTISLAHARAKNLAWAAMLPNQSVFAALNELNHRSILFLIGAIITGTALSLMFSRRLTRGLSALNSAAERLGRGDYSSRFVFGGHDELGTLGQRLEHLAADIRTLLNQTNRDARHAQLSETQAVVERHIFPRQKFYRNGAVRLSGLQRESSVAAGDWWFYFQSGQDLFVILADAAGTGIETALLIATARSILTTLDRATTTLVRIANAIDRAIDECSEGNARLSGILLRVNVESGESETLTASHEPPVHLASLGSKLSGRFLIGKANAAFGSRPGVWFAEQFTLNRGDRLLIYTKGFLKVENKSGALYSDRRLLEYFERELNGELDPVEILAKLEKQFVGLANHASMIAIDFQA